MVQVLHLSNGATLNEKLHAPGNRLDKLLRLRRQGMSSASLIDELYLACLSRYPTETERQHLLELLPPAGATAENEIVEDIVLGAYEQPRVFVQPLRNKGWEHARTRAFSMNERGIRLMLRLTTLAVVLIAVPSVAADGQRAADYSAQIAPVFKKYCAGCHNDDDREGKFSLESYAALQRGTAHGPALLPGDPKGSRIIRVLTGAAKPIMPPEDEPRPTAERDRAHRRLDRIGRPRTAGPGARPPRACCSQDPVECESAASRGDGRHARRPLARRRSRRPRSVSTADVHLAPIRQNVCWDNSPAR